MEAVMRGVGLTKAYGDVQALKDVGGAVKSGRAPPGYMESQLSELLSSLAA